MNNRVGHTGDTRTSLSSHLKSLLGLCAGLALTAYFLSSVNLDQVRHALANIGYGIMMLAVLHAFSILLDSEGWNGILKYLREHLGRLWVAWTACQRNATQTLVPVGASGFIAGYRVLYKHGVKTHAAIASLICETTITTGVELALLLISAVAAFAGRWGVVQQRIFIYVPIVAIMVFALVMILFFQVRGEVFKRLSRWLLVIGPAADRHTRAIIPLRIKRDLRRLYRAPKVLMLVAVWQVFSLLAGAVSVWLTFALIHYRVSFAVAIFFLCLSRSIRSFGFLIPSAWGLQEGLFLAFAPLAGVPAAFGIAVSLVLRVRDFIFAILVFIAGYFVRPPAGSKKLCDHVYGQPHDMAVGSDR